MELIAYLGEANSLDVKLQVQEHPTHVAVNTNYREDSLTLSNYV